MEQYKNNDGTYTSPKNGKTYKSLKAFTAHWYNRGTGGWNTINSTKKPCKFCHKVLNLGNLVRHEKSCHLNPVNLRHCEVCNKPIKDFKNSKGTCSHSCSNKLFRHARNKIENYKSYVTICWHFHKKECIVCGENKIVAVHHYNEDHNDNRPENLIPLCPTHHTYFHSQYKNEIIEIVDNFIIEFLKTKNSV